MRTGEDVILLLFVRYLLHIRDIGMAKRIMKWLFRIRAYETVS